MKLESLPQHVRHVPGFHGAVEVPELCDPVRDELDGQEGEELVMVGEAYRIGGHEVH
jgi:hypothetical protein